VQLHQTVELLGIVPVGRDHERPCLPEARAESSRGGELGGEVGPPVRRGQVQFEQLVLAKVGLSDGREHAGGDVRRASAQTVALEHDNGQPTARGVPRARKTNDAAAYDGDVMALVWKR
jgi:hypothetical protein